jgi:DNA-binding IclR family transcriptional regulator
MAKETAADGTVGKALGVLDQVASYGRPVRFSELLANSNYPKATLFRLLQTLTNQGMLMHDPETGTYALGVRLVRLAHAAWRQSSLAPIARPHIDALAQAVGETVHLAQLDNAQVLYVDKRSATVPVDMFSQAGRVGPAYCTGVGKAMLAFLPEREIDRILSQQSYHRFTANTLTSAGALREELRAIRARGHAFDDEEHEPGIICVATPVLSTSQRVLGAVSITSTTARSSLAELGLHSAILKEVANRIARDVENWQFPEDQIQSRKTG